MCVHLQPSKCPRMTKLFRVLSYFLVSHIFYMSCHSNPLDSQKEPEFLVIDSLNLNVTAENHKLRMAYPIVTKSSPGQFQCNGINLINNFSAIECPSVMECQQLLECLLTNNKCSTEKVVKGKNHQVRVHLGFLQSYGRYNIQVPFRTGMIACTSSFYTIKNKEFHSLQAVRTTIDYFNTQSQAVLISETTGILQFMDIKITRNQKDGESGSNLSDYSLFEDEEITVECFFDNFVFSIESQTLEIIKKDKSIMNIDSNLYDSKIKSGNTILRINKFRMTKDVDKILCSGQALDIVRKIIQVTVKNPPDSHLEPPKIISHSFKEEGPHRSGHVFILQCEYSGYPTPYILWFRNSKEILYMVGESLNGLTETSFLSTYEPAGNETVYTCVAVNHVGNDSRDFQIGYKLTQIDSTTQIVPLPKLNDTQPLMTLCPCTATATSTKDNIGAKGSETLSESQFSPGSDSTTPSTLFTQSPELLNPTNPAHGWTLMILLIFFVIGLSIGIAIFRLKLFLKKMAIKTIQDTSDQTVLCKISKSCTDIPENCKMAETTIVEFFPTSAS